MSLTCFRSPDRAAINASILYDERSETGHLWMRGNQQSPLPKCSSPSSPDSPCHLCQDQDVFVLCRNLTDGVKMVMEGQGFPLDVVKSECPKLHSDDDTSSTLDSTAIAIITITIIIVFLVGVTVCVCKKRRDSRKRERGTRPSLQGTELQAVETTEQGL